MKRWFRWVKGRQAGSTYQKMMLAGWLFFDVYILRFGAGCYIKRHKDIVLGKKHHRLNIILRRAEKGGIFVLESEYRRGRTQLFRPDIQAHSQTMVEGSKTQYMLSIGWITPQPKSL